MIGNGVEFSERNTIWLVEGLGIIRDKLEHRWSGQDWAEFSTIEYLESSSSEDDFLGRMFGGYKILNVNDFENEPSLNHDPFRPSYPTSIIQ